MDNAKIFGDRLKKIGINVRFIGNAPWIYLDTVNGKKVKGTFQDNHGFTAFFVTRNGYEITDIKAIFKKIRETLSDS